MSAILILGNGFDLALGKNTSYKNFLESKQFERHVNMSLFKYLCAQRDLNNWVDVEISLKRYAQELGNKINNRQIYNVQQRLNAIDQFKIDYRQLKLDLVEYLLFDHENCILDIEFSNLFVKWLDDLVNKIGHLDIVTFNYTESVKHLIGFRNNINIYEVHNNIKGEIIFGTDDVDDSIIHEFSFILKSLAGDFGQIYNFYDRFQSIDTIIIYGHSLGLTDINYFQKHFLQISNLPKRGNKEIIIYYYDGCKNDPNGLDAKLSINMNLKAMLGQKLTDFKDNCSLRFLPTTTFGSNLK